MSPVVRERGFALVVTISLLVLLMVVGVGLLSLSAIAMRSASQESAHAMARANARLALLMALGELQQAAGSDQRVTASARIRDPEAPVGLTGVWESWRPPPTADDGYEPTAKDRRFRRRLLSLADRTAQTSPEVPVLGGAGSVILCGDGTLGESLPGEPDNLLSADRIEVSGSKGGYAWAVMDEGVKARIDLPPLEDREKSTALAMRSITAGSAHRDAAWHQPELEPIQTKSGELGRLASWRSTDILLGGDSRVASGAFFNDFSVVSRGLLTNTAEGGLKQDLSLLFGKRDDQFPAEYLSRRVYPERSGFSTDPANPYWSMLQDYATKYQDLENIGGRPGIRAAIPSDADLRGSAALITQPRSAILAPVVARVELVFSIVARDAHGPWRNRVSGKPLMVHMVYSPVVTLYNPYNVPIAFDEIEVEFEDVPIGFQFYRNGQAMAERLASFNQFYAGDDAGMQSKTFGFRLREMLGSSRSNTAIIEPGATRIFGLNVEPTWSWDRDRPGDGNTIFDWRKTGRTEDFVLARGCSSGMGFDIDWLVPRSAGHTPAFLSARAGGVLHCSTRDRIDVAFGPALPPAMGRSGSFFVNVGVGSGRDAVNFTRIEVAYRDLGRLTASLEARSDDEDFKYPIRMERPLTGGRIYEANGTLLRDYSRIMPFAAFSLRGKTTLDSSEWVRAWADCSPVTRASLVDMRHDTSQAKYPYEVALRPVVPNTEDGSVDLDEGDRGFYFSGNSAQTGTKVAAAYEIPLAPLQSVAQLRHANLNSSGQLPAITHTVGESRLHPLLPSDEVSGTSGRMKVLDHTWLANDTLWDDYFFSTLAAEEGLGFGSKARDREKVIREFLAGTAPLSNARFVPAGSGEKWREQVFATLTGDEGHRRAAEFLLQDGDFNVNSTSVAAWMAVLGGLDERTLALLRLEGDGGDNEGGFKEAEETVIDSAFPRLRRPLDGSIDRQVGGGFDRSIFWSGFRELEAGYGSGGLRELAEEIVAIVKERGPFLSLSEFVNRQLGPPNREACLKGALQLAIDRSGVNAETSPKDGHPLTPLVAANYGYTTPEAVEGSTAAGYPGDISQGDILSLIGSRISVRSDTFKIRAYGDAVDASGRVLARAWCEATVQRVPGFVDSSDEPSQAAADLSDANRAFGRRFVIAGFRWLSPKEV
ncbi:MAG: hypothetical protein ACO3SO_08335 [Luteolibacter sp.]